MMKIYNFEIASNGNFEMMYENWKGSFRDYIKKEVEFLQNARNTYYVSYKFMEQGVAVISYTLKSNFVDISVRSYYVENSKILNKAYMK